MLCNAASDAGLDGHFFLSASVRQQCGPITTVGAPVGSGTMPVGKRSRNSSAAFDPPDQLTRLLLSLTRWETVGPGSTLSAANTRQFTLVGSAIWTARSNRRYSSSQKLGAISRPW